MAEEQSQHDETEEIKPRGTMAILIVFVFMIIVLWGSVYWILLQQGTTL